MNRPEIKHFIPNTTLSEVQEIYRKSPILWGYIQALDAYIDYLETKAENLPMPSVTGSSFEGHFIDGITEGKDYQVTYEGKDEVQVINDFGVKAEYSKNCFKNYL